MVLVGGGRIPRGGASGRRQVSAGEAVEGTLGPEPLLFFVSQLP